MKDEPQSTKKKRSHAEPQSRGEKKDKSLVRRCHGCALVKRVPPSSFPLDPGLRRGDGGQGRPPH